MTPRERIARQVRARFAAPDGRPAVKPAPPDARLLPPGSVAFDVHADVTSMMIGGISSLLLQMLHPKALAGVWDFSNFRTDMGGRLRRTAAFIAVTTYGEREQAEAAIARVCRIHSRVSGHLPDGTPYKADDPQLLAFVGVTEALSFLDAWVRYREPLMLLRDQDRYIAEMARISRLLGANPMPETRRDAERFLLAVRPQLKVDSRTREVATLILTAAPPPPPAAHPRHGASPPPPPPGRGRSAPALGPPHARPFGRRIAHATAARRRHKHGRSAQMGPECTQPSASVSVGSNRYVMCVMQRFQSCVTPGLTRGQACSWHDFLHGNVLTY